MKKFLTLASMLVLISIPVSGNAAEVTTATAAAKAVTLSAEDPSLKWTPGPAFFPAGTELAVLRGNPATGESDAFLRIPANARIPAHTHTSAEHMILVSGELDVRYEGQPKQTLKAGMFAYGPPLQAHEATCKTGPCVLFISFDSPIDAHPATLTPESTAKKKK